MLKPNMVISGKKCAQIAPRPSRWPRPRCGCSSATCRRRCRASRSSPAGRARPRRPCTCAHERRGPLPWTLTFSYGRALQDDRAERLGRHAARIRGRPEGLLQRARLNGLAAGGEYRAHGNRCGVGCLGPPIRVPASRLRTSYTIESNPAIVEIRDVHYAVSGRAQSSRPGHGHRARQGHRRDGAERYRQDHAAAPHHRAGARRRRARSRSAAQDVRA